MRLTVSTHTHPESPISGSTVEAMVDRAAKLGRTHFSYTDPGYMTSLFRAYNYCKDKYTGKPDKKGNTNPKLGFIPGIEIFFKDPTCDIVKNTKADSASYFKLTLYATNQDQFQKLSQIASRKRDSAITFYGETYPAWDWKDVTDCALEGMVAVSSDVHDMVSKHLVTGTPRLAEQVFLKLKGLFGSKYFVSIIGNEVSKTWVNLVELSLADGSKHVIYANSRVTTNAAKFAQAKELVENPYKHHTIHAFQSNFVTKTLDRPLKVNSAKPHSGFMPLPEGDVQAKANKLMYALAKRHDVKVLYSDYAFYADQEDKTVQDVRLYQEEIREHTKRHMQSTEECSAYLKNTMLMSDDQITEVLDSTSSWASMFDSFSLSYGYSLPEVEGDKSALEKCMEIIKNVGRLPKDRPDYLERLKYEIQVLAKNGKIDLTPYFLPIADVFDFYKKEGRLTGPGRGSAGGSLLLYLMGITHLDPVKWGLSFERFLSLDRVLTGNMPDVDVDLVDREPLVGPDGMSGYLYGRWGAKAAQISTRTQLRLKSSIKDVNKYFNEGSVDAEIEKLTKSLPDAPQGVSDMDFVFGFEDSDGNHTPGLIEISEDLKKYAESRPKEWSVVQRCLGISRQNSRHASAFVIANKPIDSVLPTFLGGNVTQYEAKSVEKAKLIKYDFLVVNQLKDIEGCLKRINKKNGDALPVGNFKHLGKELFIWDLPEDLEVFKASWNGDTETIFQISTQSMIPFVKKIKPKTLVDLATILALVRPGPLDYVDPETGLTMADEYVERRNGRGTVKLPELAQLIPETYGVQCFQEQTTKVAKEIGKMKPTDAEELRRIFSKKEKAKALAMKPVFMEGAVATVGKEKAEMIWAQMETSSRYSFNFSHAAAYCVISYACMFLKHYYPLEWWASVLSNADEKEISTTLFRHVRDKVLPPDVNISSNEVAVDYETGTLRAKMTVMKGLGESVSRPIVENAPYSDIKDFIKKKVAGPSLTQKLIHVGVMDSLFPKNLDLVGKMQLYHDTVNVVAYEEKLSQGKKPKPPKPGEVDSAYLSMSPLQDFKARKMILPTLPANLSSLVAKYCPLMNEGTVEAPMFADERGRAYKMITGDQLERLLSLAPFNQKNYFCVPAFVVDMKEFTYSNNEKKALKMFLDIDGKVEERVLWPSYGTNSAQYPPNLVKNSVVMLYMCLKELKDVPNIYSIRVIA